MVAVSAALAWRALDAIPSAVVIADEQLRLVWRNRRGAEIREGASGLGEWLAGLAGADDARRWVDETCRVMDEGIDRVLGYAVQRQDDGTEKLGRVSAAPIELEPGRRGAMVMVEVRGQESPGDGAGVEASKHLTALGGIVARLAHEINSPLDGSYRFVNLGLRLARELGLGQIEDCLAESATAHRRMMRVVSELLEFARRPARQETTDVNTLLSEVLRMVTERAAQQRVLIVSDFSEPMPRVEADAVYQVMSNLVRNALDAMPEGGTLTVSSRMRGRTVVIRVDDSGHGLPADAEKIFEPFFTTKPPGEGTGLGLAICREIVTGRLGGRIAARPRAGGGATLEVEIPADRDGAAGAVGGG